MQISMAAARVNAGLTQKEVAAAANITVATLSAWENGRLSPPVAKAQKLCELYNRTLDDIEW